MDPIYGGGREETPPPKIKTLFKKGGSDWTPSPPPFHYFKAFYFCPHPKTQWGGGESQKYGIEWGVGGGT